MNVIDRHDNWCKENKHSKLIASSRRPYVFTNNEGKEQTIYYVELLPNQAYASISEHISHIKGLKSINDIDFVLIRDGKSETSKYKCFDKTDYPKYFDDEEAFKVSSNDSLTEEEKKYELYDIDKLYAVTSYSRLRKNLSGLFKLCDAELGTSFEKEIDDLCKQEAAKNAAEKQVQNDSDSNSDVEEEVNEEKFTSIEDEPKQEKVRREAKPTKPNIEDIKTQCEKYFSSWNKLNENEKSIMLSFNN